MAEEYSSQVASRDSSEPRLAVIGSGIAGLAHAWAAAKRNWKVDVFERNPFAKGASIRNFGMVWPIGQPNGPYHRVALNSRSLWLEFLESSGFWKSECGSLHLAYREDELAVLEEFAEISESIGFDCRVLTPAEARERSPAVRTDSVLGALWSPTEVTVDPRQVIHGMPRWLEKTYGVRFHFGTTIDQVRPRNVRASDGSHLQVDRVIVAAGADFRLLYPDMYSSAGFRLCKLQMLRTVPQPGNWKLGPMLASGLTLRHYDSFSICSTLPALRNRIASETPELDDFGIHVMAAQNEAGELVLGDSHEYGQDVPPFDKPLIDDLILRELRRLIDVPDWTICERWNGVYAKAPDCIEYVSEPEAGVFVIIPSGGCGMTMSFGLAEEKWQQWPEEGNASDLSVAPQVEGASH